MDKIDQIFLIAEIGQAHEGSLGILHSYIDALAETGVHAVKFQTHIAEAESSEHEQFRVKFSYEDTTRFDYWKRMEFTAEQWAGIKKHCEDKNLEFISSPFSVAAVELLEKLGVKKYKIGSGEVLNLLMLEMIASTGKEIIVSSGMSSYTELDKSISFLKKFGNRLSIMQCTTSYPTKPEQWGLNVITELKERYKLPVGFSDHSGDIYACLAAASLGAQLLEFHVVFDKRMFGPDSTSSLSMEQVKNLATGTRAVSAALNSHVDKNNIEAFSALKTLFEKSLAINKDLKAGHKIQLTDLESKKPKGFGIPATEFSKVLGKTIKRDMSQWEFLNISDLNDYVI